MLVQYIQNNKPISWEPIPDNHEMLLADLRTGQAQQRADKACHYGKAEKEDDCTFTINLDNQTFNLKMGDEYDKTHPIDDFDIEEIIWDVDEYIGQRDIWSFGVERIDNDFLLTFDNRMPVLLHGFREYLEFMMNLGRNTQNEVAISFLHDQMSEEEFIQLSNMIFEKEGFSLYIARMPISGDPINGKIIDEGKTLWSADKKFYKNFQIRLNVTTVLRHYFRYRGTEILDDLCASQ